jgi:O-Antigen ligase
MTQVYKPNPPTQKAPDSKLFFWFWVRWGALSVGERFVCANIILIPVWWALGIYKYMTFLLLSCVLLYEWKQHGELRLKPPTTPAIALFAFGIYQVLRILINYSHPERPSIGGVFLTWFSYALLLWYIQSHDVRLRIEAIAWACTVSVVQMLGFWALLQFVLPDSLFQPPIIPTLFGLLTGIGSGEIEGGLLAPYEVSGGTIAEVYRLSLFFISSQFFSLVVGCIGLIALEVKNRIWSLLLLLACAFLIILSFSRSVWVAFPIVVWLRYLFSTYGQPRNRAIIFAVMAVASFAILSIAPVTDFLVDSYTDLTQNIAEMRAASTEQRSEIYRLTWEAFQENPVWGQVGKGRPISLASPEQNVIGSHSVILGNLLYGNGLVGTGIFALFWISLFIWLYKTRAGRPLTCFCVLIMFTLVSTTLGAMWFSPFSALIILLCVAIRHPKIKPARETRPCLNF